MQEIARRAGVSTATVSYVLNNRVRKGSSISDATRQRVLDIAEELGYRRNELAHAVKTGKNRMIGLLLANRAPRLAEFLSHITYGVLDEAEEQNFTIKILRFRDEQMERTIERCAELRLAGLCIIGGGARPVTSLRQSRLTQNIPLAVFSHIREPEPGTIYVTPDDEHCFDEAVAHLYALGHRRIAFLAGITNHVESARREASFQRAMAAHNLDVPPDFSEFCNWKSEITARTVDRWLSLPTPPTAIICPSDYMAMEVLRLVHQRGVSVPSQLSIVGFGGFSIGDITHPPLSTVAMPLEEMGRTAVRHLLDAKAPISQHTALPVTFIARESTGPAPKN
jgi:LacI family transcriptional regulator